MYCYVALSDLTNVVQERCRGRQTDWDVCLCQFYTAVGEKKFPTVRIFFVCI